MSIRDNKSYFFILNNSTQTWKKKKTKTYLFMKLLLDFMQRLELCWWRYCCIARFLIPVVQLAAY
jgi:hypothetical protein